MKTLLTLALTLLCIPLLSGCGSDTSQTQTTTTRNIKAVIKPTALTATRNIAGIQLSLSVPAGVTPPLQTDGTVDASATVQITSSAPTSQTLPGATFTPATATTSGKLTITAIIASGFSATDTITINLNIAAGTYPVASDFTLNTFEAFDINGAKITGLNPTLTTTIQ